MNGYVMLNGLGCGARPSSDSWFDASCEFPNGYPSSSMVLRCLDFRSHSPQSKKMEQMAKMAKMAKMVKITKQNGPWKLTPSGVS